MLTVEWVRARRRGEELKLLSLSGTLREEALSLAESYVEVMTSAKGETRAEVQRALAGVVVSGRAQKIGGGFRKLIDDRSEYVVEADVDAAALRKEIFTSAAAARRASTEPMDRDGWVADRAEEKGWSPDELLRRLYADLRQAHRLVSYEAITPAALLEAYENGQTQAVLLKAMRVRLDVECASPASYRQLFRKLKFQRLLYQLEEKKEGGYRILIDGPFSLMRASTKYGLKLAMLLPAIRDCDQWTLEADVRWGKARRELLFRSEGSRVRVARGRPKKKTSAIGEVATLIERWRKKDGGWDVAEAEQVLSLAGVGVCVPDLVFTHRESGVSVFFEVMGYWSREAVFKRAELVKAGMNTPVVFAASTRLRVSPELIEDSHASGLYMYKGSLDRAAVLRHLETARERLSKA